MMRAVLRIVELDIALWRNVRGLHLVVPEEASIICLVGANGSGKSGLLDLVAGVAWRLGLATGFHQSRGEPFSDDHQIRARLRVSPDTKTRLMDRCINEGFAVAAGWNGE